MFICETNNGKIVTNEFLREDILNNPKAKYQVERIVGNRTNAQNRYLWLYLDIIEKNTGNSSKDMHEYIKKYLTPKKTVTVTVKKDGKLVRMSGSTGKGTSELSKVEFIDMLDKLCADTEVALPDPEEAGFVKDFLVK